MGSKVKFALVTGASSGFGKEIARVLAQEGYSLILWARRIDRLEQLKKELESDQIQVVVHQVDVRDEAQVLKVISEIPAEHLSNIEVLINNAGLAVGRSSVEDGITDDWERMIDTNLKGLLYVSKAIIPYLKANQSGSIINMGSIAGKEAYPSGNVYCASKAAVDQLTKAMRLDLVMYNIRVGLISPGAALTEFSNVRFKGDVETAQKVYDGFEPLSAMDVAEAVRFMVTRPPHVSIHDLVIMPTAQASATVFNKSNLGPLK